nr:unnamed protein product [Callosobruchus chinensis]
MPFLHKIFMIGVCADPSEDYLVSKNKASLYIYHGRIAKKSPNEVCLLLLDYISNNSEGASELHLYSDNYWGQNKNHALLGMLLALTGTKKFDKILQYFPVREHSFLPCDRDFSIIKRALKKRYRIYNVHNLTEIIANASRTQKFEVREVVTIEITNFKAWWPRFYKKNAGSLESRNLEKKTKGALQYQQDSLFFESESSGTVKAAGFIKGVVEHTFDLYQSGNNIALLPTTPCYPVRKVPIRQKKIDGFRQCIKYIEDTY